LSRFSSAARALFALEGGAAVSPFSMRTKNFHRWQIWWLYCWNQTQIGGTQQESVGTMMLQSYVALILHDMVYVVGGALFSVSFAPTHNVKRKERRK
jgi:hypothetical protein